MYSYSTDVSPSLGIPSVMMLQSSDNTSESQTTTPSGGWGGGGGGGEQTTVLAKNPQLVPESFLHTKLKQQYRCITFTWDPFSNDAAEF